jgi:hypothetical protein
MDESTFMATSTIRARYIYWHLPGGRSATDAYRAELLGLA